jgi:hypothetical protein
VQEVTVKNLTVVCLDTEGTLTASGSIIEPGVASKIELTVDAPSVLTGAAKSRLLFALPRQTRDL